ncbi:hypothetical protein I4U23_011242 [Adineta vaga]|nr:hypothetical protein I4U23_011242 [Adineta vaga]
MITYMARFLSVLYGYATGMALYRRDNCERNYWHMVKVNVTALMDEFVEVLEEIWYFRWGAFFLEMCDVWHTLVVLFIRTLLPKFLQQSKWIWLMAFFIAGGITPWKHGARYVDQGCIRNARHCQQGDHKCSNSKYLTK